MRIVSVDGSSVIEEQPGGAVVRGTDDRTGELVTFTADLDEAADIRNLHTTLLEVSDEDIIKVEPTSGQWDSPGTAPEEPGA